MNTEGDGGWKSPFHLVFPNVITEFRENATKPSPGLPDSNLGLAHKSH